MPRDRSKDKNKHKISNEIKSDNLGRFRNNWQKIRAFFTPERLRVLLVIVCLAAMTITTWMAWPSFYETEKQNIDGSIDYLPYRLKTDDVLRQSFVPSHEGLSSFYLSFDLNREWQNPEEARLKLEFFAVRDDESVAAGNTEIEPVYSLDIDGNDINQYIQTELPLNLGKDSQDQEFELVLTVLELPEEQSLYIHTNSSSLRPLQINGLRRGLALTMTLSYVNFDWATFRLALLLMAVILLLLFVPTRKLGSFMTTYSPIPLLLAPALLLMLIELFNSLNHDIWLQMPVFWLTYLIILLIELILVGITGSCRIGIYLNLALFASLAIGNHTKLFFRGDPFVAGDLRVLTEAAQTVNDLQFVASSRFLLGWLVLLIYAILFIDMQKKERGRRLRVFMIVGPVVAFAVYMNVFVLSPDRLDKLFEVQRYPWNNMMNYKQNGFTIPFFQSVHHLVITPPEESRPVNQAVYDLPDDAVSDTVSATKPHVIAIMSESYADFNNIKDIETSEPVMPFFDWLRNQPQTLSGNLLVSVFGGGTCNTEFEFLTGSSMLFMNDGIMPYTSYFGRPTHSMAEIYKQQGYSTLAIHPYNRAFWDRHKVYPNIGFDEFIALEDFPEGGEVRQFKGDRAAFDQIKNALESNEPGERQFIFTVTMQNHFPYYGEEDILADLKYNIKMPGMIDVEAVELYLSILRESDDALRELYTYLNKLDEPVMLVFFGDHLPGNNNVFNSFYESMFEKPITDLSPSETQKMYETPYFIWTNYNLQEQLDVSVADYKKELTSPNFLASSVLELSGSAVSPYFNMLGSLQDDITAMNNRLIILESGRRFNREEVPSSLTRLLDRYWRYEYDNIIAKKEAEE